jgi:pimeloyl-ACP methyl ester carboxylesterase
MPGFGRSSFAAPDALPSYRMRHVAGVMCSMLQQLGLRGQPVTVVGHDWGAAVAWTLAITAPQVHGARVVTVGSASEATRCAHVPAADCSTQPLCACAHTPTHTHMCRLSHTQRWCSGWWCCLWATLAARVTHSSWRGGGTR